MTKYGKYSVSDTIKDSAHREMVENSIKIAEMVAYSMRENPKAWKEDEYTISNGEMVFWIGNGEAHFKTYRNSVINLSREVCHKIVWPAYVDWKNMKLTSYIKKKNKKSLVQTIRDWFPRKKPLQIEYKPEQKL